MNPTRITHPRSPIPTVNFHCWRPCNMRCRHCFARFNDAGHDNLSRSEMLAVVQELARGFERINFVGGEPTLCPWFVDALDVARASGARTSLVTNGWAMAKRTDFRDAVLARVDGMGLSIDSRRSDANVTIGRVVGRRTLHVDELLELAEVVRGRGLHLKVNTVVQQANLHEDFGDLLNRVRPDRWKVFRVLPVHGQNDADYHSVAITDEQFSSFLARHTYLAEAGVAPVPENHDAMTGSYAMVDPGGFAYDNVDGTYRDSREPVHRCGWRAAFAEVRVLPERFASRGGHYLLERGDQ
ncbi:MAG: radical SAM protein [Planctomycetes bacterium]|nr:radical SAM protein [Planctomycetota bacterium]